VRFDEPEHAKNIAAQLAGMVDQSRLLWELQVEALRDWCESTWCENTFDCFFVDWLVEELADEKRRDLETLVEDWLWKKRIDCPMCGGEKTVTCIDESRISSNYEQPADYDAPCPLCCG
jgi:hypothetical protein